MTDDDELCPNCGEPGCDSECLLIGTGAPGRDRARYVRDQTQEREQAQGQGVSDSPGSHHIA